jgi:hypothetical protein
MSWISNSHRKKSRKRKAKPAYQPLLERLEVRVNPSTYNLGRRVWRELGLDGAGSLTVSGLTTWSGGTMSGTGATNADGGMTLSGGGLELLNSGRTLNNNGTANWSGASNVIELANGAVRNNAVGSVLNSQAAGQFVQDGGGSAPAFNNAGLFQVTTGNTTVQPLQQHGQRQCQRRRAFSPGRSRELLRHHPVRRNVFLPFDSTVHGRRDSNQPGNHNPRRRCLSDRQSVGHERSGQFHEQRRRRQLHRSERTEFFNHRGLEQRRHRDDRQRHRAGVG